LQAVKKSPANQQSIGSCKQHLNDATQKNLRANVAKNQTFSKYCGNSSNINSAQILMLGRP